jgi:hypothetical protein
VDWSSSCSSFTARLHSDECLAANPKDYRLVGLSQVRAPTYGRPVTNPEPTTMTELIEDCADIPHSITHADPPLPAPRAAVAWQVDERCANQVEGLNDYGS